MPKVKILYSHELNLVPSFTEDQKVTFDTVVQYEMKIISEDINRCNGYIELMELSNGHVKIIAHCIDDKIRLRMAETITERIPNP